MQCCCCLLTLGCDQCAVMLSSLVECWVEGRLEQVMLCGATRVVISEQGPSLENGSVIVYHLGDNSGDTVQA